MNSRKFLKYDDAMSTVGGEGRYQIQLFLNLGTQWILMAMVFMNATFWLQPPNFICEGGKSCDESKATSQGRCSKEYIDRTDKDYLTITEDLEMYCEHSDKLVWAQSVVYIGAAIGSFLITQVSDYVGRKMPIFICQAIAAVSIVGLSFANSYWLFMVLYFIVGFTIWPVETIMYTLINEAMNGKLRNRSMIGCMLFWSVGEVLIALIAYEIPNWRDGMFYTIAIPYLCYSIPNFLLIFESPVFYLRRSQEMCLQALNKIANFNNKQELGEGTVIIPDEIYDEHQQQIEGNTMKTIQDDEQYDKNSLNEELSIKSEENIKLGSFLQNIDDNKGKTYFIWDVFRYASLRKDLFTCSFVLAGLNIIYFGSSLSLGSLSSNVYISMAVVSSCEAVSNFACAYFAHLFPRKKSMLILYALTMVICISFLAFGKVNDSEGNQKEESTAVQAVQLTLAGFARVFNIFGMAVYSLYCQEIFPTPVRSMASGFTYAFSTLITFLMPFAVSLANYLNIYPIAILGISGIIFYIPGFFFEETLNQPMRQYIVEEKQMEEIKYIELAEQKFKKNLKNIKIIKYQ